MEMGDIIRQKREEIIGIAASHGVHNIRLFGSVARGEEHDQSDVDFLVELDEGRDLFDLGSLLMDLQDLLQCRVETVTESALHPSIRDHVLREAIKL